MYYNIMRILLNFIVLMAELLKRYFPKFVHLYNYSAVNSAAKKLDNWHTLNRKVLSKIHFKISKENIEKLAHSRPGTIEDVLIELRSKILEDHNSRQDALLNAYKNGMGGLYNYCKVEIGLKYY